MMNRRKSGEGRWEKPPSKDDVSGKTLRMRRECGATCKFFEDLKLVEGWARACWSLFTELRWQQSQVRSHTTDISFPNTEIGEEYPLFLRTTKKKLLNYLKNYCKLWAQPVVQNACLKL